MKRIFLTQFLIIGLLSFWLAGKTFAQEATNSSDAIREKVQEKVDRVLKSPRAYIGTVADISSNTLQITRFALANTQAKSGEIQQISIQDSTILINTIKTDKEIKLTDIAIGDFVIAMGYQNGNNILEATRVLITDTVKESQRTSVYGKILSVGKKSITVRKMSGEKVDFSFGQKWNGPDIEDLQKDELVLAVGTLTEKEDFKVRTIKIIPRPGENSQTISTPTPTSSTSSPESSPSSIE